MKAFERIFLYTVLAILVFYVFLVDRNVEGQVVIQEEIRARSIVIVNTAGQKVVMLCADSRTEGGGRVDISTRPPLPQPRLRLPLSVSSYQIPAPPSPSDSLGT